MRSFTIVPALLLFIGQCNTALGQEAHLRASLYSQVTLSDNAHLAAKGDEEADLFFQFTPSFNLVRNSARLKLSINYAPTLSIYPFTEGDARITNNLHSLASASLIQDFLFLDASAAITQSFVSPFSPRLLSDSNQVDNQSEVSTFGLSPYVRGTFPNGFTYLARNDLHWTTSDASSLSNLLEDHAFATLESPRRARARIGFDFDYRYTKYESVPYYYTAVTRARPGLQLRPNLLVSARVGYERNNYSTDESGVVYGAGIQWSPTPRTNLNAFAEKRFFGTGYNVDFAHRTRLTSWRLLASRDIRTYREQGLQLEPGFTVFSLNDALTPRIPDIGERIQAIERILANAGLPPVLFSPFTFVANQPYLSQQVSATAALLTRRNTATLHLFWQENKPIVTSGAISTLPDVFQGSNTLEQRGGGVTLSHQLQAGTTATADLTRTYAKGHLLSSGVSGAQDSVTDWLRLSLTRELGPKTQGSVGVRWVNYRSDIKDYVEHAAYVSLNHHF